MANDQFENGEVVNFKPSQWVNFFWLCLIAFCAVILADSVISENIPSLRHKLIGIPISHLWWMIFPLALGFRKILMIACWRYEFIIGGDTITQVKGVLNQQSVDIHRFRIKSIKVERPFFLRIMGLANVIVLTSEPFMPVLTFYAISEAVDPTPDELARYLRESAKYWRKVNGVKETDFHSF